MGLVDLFDYYRSKGVLVDTNILVLLAVGTYQIRRIKTFNRTKAYSVEDFRLVSHLVCSFDRRITTPHILAEAHSLARQLDKREYEGLAAAFRKLIDEMFEVHVPATEVALGKIYPRLGLTDSAILKASDGVLVLTDDQSLSLALEGLGRHAININHIRTDYWT